MFTDGLNTANGIKELSIVESGCSVFGEIKKGANLASNKGCLNTANRLKELNTVYIGVQC